MCLKHNGKKCQFPLVIFPSVFADKISSVVVMVNLFTGSVNRCMDILLSVTRTKHLDLINSNVVGMLHEKRWIVVPVCDPSKDTL